MKKTIGMLLVMALALYAAAGVGESLFVDNRETDKVYPERLNMRSEPSKNGAIIGLYYSGAEVENLGAENEEYTRVSIGGVSGYMASEYLITAQEAEARYGADSGFGDYRAAEIDLTGMWAKETALLADTDLQSAVIGTLRSGERVGLVGVLDTWAYIAADLDGEKNYGYVPLDVLTDVDELKVSIVAGERADTRTILYSAPNDKAKEIMIVKNGTACFHLFGRKEGEWRRVRVGGVSGWIRYTQTDNLHMLGSEQRSVIPYYPLLMQTKGEALLYSSQDEAAYMTLDGDMKVEVLAEAENMVYIRTLEGGAGAYDCGDFGFMKLSDLKLSSAAASVGLAQVDNGDLPAVVLAEPDEKAEMIGALCGGAQIRILDYTQTDYAQVALNGLKGYVAKDSLRILTRTGENLSQRIPQRGVVLEDVVLSDEPKKGTAGEETAAAGSRVYILGKAGDWAYVRAAGSPNLDVLQSGEDATGFVPLDQLNAPMSTTHLTAFVTTDKVNLRSQDSSTEGAIIGKARTGERLLVGEYGENWTLVETPKGLRGYIMTKYLTFE